MVNQLIILSLSSPSPPSFLSFFLLPHPPHPLAVIDLASASFLPSFHISGEEKRKGGGREGIKYSLNMRADRGGRGEEKSIVRHRKLKEKGDAAREEERRKWEGEKKRKENPRCCRVVTTKFGSAYSRL